jgi:hypothetical protein
MVWKTLTYVGIVAVLVAVAAYLVVPPISLLASRPGVSDVSPPIAIDSRKQCKAGTIYVTTVARQYHENEGYEFTVDDNCAALQKSLVEAIRNNDLDGVTRLIGNGANPETADWSMNESMFPLEAAVYQEPKIVKVLLDNGANPNREFCCCASCSSPLTIAIREKRVETVRLLLDRGASLEYRPKFTDGDFDSALEVSTKEVNQEIIDMVTPACQEQFACRLRLRTRSLLRLVGI